MQHRLRKKTIGDREELPKNNLIARGREGRYEPEELPERTQQIPLLALRENVRFEKGDQKKYFGGEKKCLTGWVETKGEAVTVD